MTPYRPPLTITPEILACVEQVGETLGRWSVTAAADLSPRLRRGHRIRTIHASLAIENNSLSLEQVTAVLDGKRILGLPREIQEVRNAFAAYDQLSLWDPTSLDDLLAAHAILMAGLMDEPGRLRTGGVAVVRDRQDAYYQALDMQLAAADALSLIDGLRPLIAADDDPGTP